MLIKTNNCIYNTYAYKQGRRRMGSSRSIYFFFFTPIRFNFSPFLSILKVSYHPRTYFFLNLDLNNFTYWAHKKLCSHDYKTIYSPSVLFSFCCYSFSSSWSKFPFILFIVVSFRFFFVLSLISSIR